MQSQVQEELHIKLCLGQIPAWLILLPVPLGLSLSGGTCTLLLLAENSQAPCRSENFPVLKWKSTVFRLGFPGKSAFEGLAWHFNP